MANGNIIVPYVLDPANATRLEIAVKIVESYPEIKHKIICDFLSALQSGLEDQYPAFTVNVSELQYKEYQRTKYWQIISMTKPSWKRDHQNIGIYLLDREFGLRGMTIGIGKSDHKSDDTWSDLFAELSNKSGPGIRDAWWYYYRKIEKCADWDHETLIELRKPSTVAFFIDQFESIRSIAEPMIDSITTKRRRNNPAKEVVSV